MAEMPLPAAGSALARCPHAPPRSGWAAAALPCRSLAGLPRLRLLSLTLVGGAVPHRELGTLAGLEELHIYLAHPTPARFDFQPSERPSREAEPAGKQAWLCVLGLLVDLWSLWCALLWASLLPARPTCACPTFVLHPAPTGALAALRRLRCILLIAPSSLCEALTLGPGLPQLDSLRELQVCPKSMSGASAASPAPGCRLHVLGLGLAWMRVAQTHTWQASAAPSPPHARHHHTATNTYLCLSTVRRRWTAVWTSCPPTCGTASSSPGSTWTSRARRRCPPRQRRQPTPLPQPRCRPCSSCAWLAAACPAARCPRRSAACRACGIWRCSAAG